MEETVRDGKRALYDIYAAIFWPFPTTAGLPLSAATAEGVLWYDIYYIQVSELRLRSDLVCTWHTLHSGNEVHITWCRFS